MDLLIGLFPLIVLIVVVAWVVERGMRNDTHDRDTGGGYDGGAD